MAKKVEDKFFEIAERVLGKAEVKHIVEVGARDCTETIRFNEQYPSAKILTFECNPATLPECRAKVAGRPNIKLIEKAVFSEEGKIKFYPTDPEKTVTTWQDGNPGASSLFKASGKYPVEQYVQREIEVDAIPLKKALADNNFDGVDLLWMDIQGAEMIALESLGEQLKNVKMIHTEVEFMEIYAGQPLYWDIKKYLNQQGFYLIDFTSFFNFAADVVFVNKRFIRNIFATLLYAFYNKAIYFRYYYARKKQGVQK